MHTYNSATKYTIRFDVADKTDEGFDIDMTYTKCKLDTSEISIENAILGNLQGIVFKLAVAKDGSLKKLLNIEDVRSRCNRMLDSLIQADKTSAVHKNGYVLSKRMIATDKGLEIALLKHFTCYVQFFGSTFYLNNPKIIHNSIQNALSDSAWDATQKINLTEIDRKNTTFTVKQEITVDKKELTASLHHYFEKNADKIPKEAIAAIAANDVEYRETCTQKTDYKKGIILNAVFIRAINLIVSNRTTKLELETVY